MYIYLKFAFHLGTKHILEMTSLVFTNIYPDNKVNVTAGRDSGIRKAFCVSEAF